MSRSSAKGSVAWAITATLLAMFLPTACVYLSVEPLVNLLWGNLFLVVPSAVSRITLDTGIPYLFGLITSFVIWPLTMVFALSKAVLWAESSTKLSSVLLYIGLLLSLFLVAPLDYARQIGIFMSPAYYGM